MLGSVRSHKASAMTLGTSVLKLKLCTCNISFTQCRNFEHSFAHFSTLNLSSLVHKNTSLTKYAQTELTHSLFFWTSTNLFYKT